MGGLSFYNKKKKDKVNLVREALKWIFDIGVVVAIASVLVHYLGAKTEVIGGSMNPTLNNGDEVLINRFDYTFSTPKRDDIIVFQPNGNEKSHYYVKRVIGLPGERLQITEGVIYINGEPQADGVNGKIEYAGLAEEEICLGEDEYFVLGDSRDNSEDSRYANVGNVRRDAIVGKAWYIISPRERMGFLR